MTVLTPDGLQAQVVMGRSRIRPSDRVRTGLGGLASRPTRTVLTAMGIAIGIASMVTVVGISASSKADLLAELDKLGTNLLQVRPGQSLLGESSQLPIEAEPMISEVGTVTDTAGITAIDTDVSRNIYDSTPNGLDVVATDGHLDDILQLEPKYGRLIDEQTQTLPVAVLGSVAGERLIINTIDGGPTVAIGGRAFQVIGILRPHPLHPDLDRSVLIGSDFATNVMGTDPNHTAIYVRVSPDRIEDTRPVLARSANPAASSEVDVSRPSDALEAQAKVDQNLQSLLLALGGVALLVGGVGIANIMVISVIERRGEIGLRRALGATRGHIRSQFVIEASALAVLGGVIGLGIGMGATWVYATSQGWVIAVPYRALGLGVIGALAIGALAGLYPASKAARLDPAEAVRPHG